MEYSLTYDPETELIIINTEYFKLVIKTNELNPLSVA